jgi:vitamin B12 transporter
MPSSVSVRRSRPFRIASPVLLALAAGVLPSASFAEDDSGDLDLPTIVVTANRTATDAREVGSAVTVIDRAELEKRQIRLVSDALRAVPGLSVGRSGSLGSLTEVRLRGSESNQTLVLIDGIEVNDPASGSSFDFANLLAQDVERIEVLRGPQSALYGSDAIGGVINIITRRGEGKTSGNFSLEAGNRGTIDGHASIGGSTDTYDYFVSAGGLTTKGFSSAAEWLGNSEPDGYRNRTAFAKVGIQAADNLRVDFVGRATGYEADGDDFLGGIGAVDSNNWTEGKQFYGRAKATLDLFDGRWQQTFGVSGTDQSYDYFYYGDWSSAYEGVKTKVDYQSVFALPDVPGVLTHSLTVALEREEDTATVESAWSNFDRSVAQTGAVAQYQVGLWNDLFLTGSVRHDANDLFGDYDTYRLTSAYNIDATGTKLRASWGTGVKNPTLFELYGYTDTYHGNADLRPERATGWDAGFDQSLFDGKAVFEATYFDQKISDLIQGAGETSVNLDGVSPIHGVELALTLNPTDALTLRGAYTWMHGEDSSGTELIRRPSNSASLDIGYAFLSRRAKVDLGVVWRGEAKDWAYADDYSTSVVTLDPYTLVNLAGSYAVSDNMELTARVENLFDVEYEDVYTYGSAGRTWVVGTNFKF